MQTNNTLFIGNKEFAKLKNNKLLAAKILAKPIKALTPTNNLIFNGGIIQVQEGGAIKLIPKKQGDKIKLIDLTANTFKDDYVAQRARGAYIATVCQPEAAFNLSFAAQAAQEPSYNNAKALNKRLQWQINNKEKGL